MGELKSQLELADIASLEELKAQIRREARKRCLDEIEALFKGESIESGIGSDVERVYYLGLLKSKIIVTGRGNESQTTI